MDKRNSSRIALIGFGEVGALFARGLAASVMRREANDAQRSTRR